MGPKTGAGDGSFLPPELFQKGSRNGPVWVPKWTQSDPKVDPKVIQKWTRNWNGYFGKGAKWAETAQRGQKSQKEPN